MKRLRYTDIAADCRAAGAVEFALVCAPFTVFLLAIIGAGLHFYLQQTLDYATQQAVRQVQLGHLSAGYTEADFVSKVFCPVFGQFQVCANLSVDLQPVTDFEHLVIIGAPGAPSSTPTTGVFCTGTPGQLMYAHVVYLAPLIGGALFGSATPGNDAIVSNAAFANENPTGSTVLPKNGC
jgi:Flp pilus assembly protein TadG